MTIAWLPVSCRCCRSLAARICRAVVAIWDYKVVMGHVGIQPEHVGLVAADDRTRAKHQFKFCAVGSSTQAFRHSFAVWTIGDWNSLPSHHPMWWNIQRQHLSRWSCPGWPRPHIRTIKCHPPIHTILHEEDCELFIRIRPPYISCTAYLILIKSNISYKPLPNLNLHHCKHRYGTAIT